MTSLLRSILAMLVLALLPLTSAAQGREKVLHTDSGRVVLHYFTSGGVSTREWTDKDERWGRSWAYKRDGSVIVDRHTRRIAGHASVHFAYHANGAISKAEYSDAPDAGIQWYQSTTTFDDQGNRTGFSEQGHDGHGLLPRPDLLTEEPSVVVPTKPVVVEEQRLFVNEMLVVNSTKWPCVVHVKPTHASPALPEGDLKLLPGDTLRVGSYTMGEVFAEPEGHVMLTADRVNKRGRKVGVLDVLYLQQLQISPDLRRHVFHVLPEGTRLKRFP